MLVFSTKLLSNLLSGSPSPLCQSTEYIASVWLGGGKGGGGVLSPVGDHILREFRTLYLTRFRNYKIATPRQTKT
jgi:hypothetical protein